MTGHQPARARTAALRSAEAGRANGRGRLCALIALASVMGVGGWLGTLSARPAPLAHLPPAALAAQAAPDGSQSSTWYCPGEPTAATTGISSSLVLVGTAGRPVRAELTAVGAAGPAHRGAVTVPATGEVSVAPPALGGRRWQADRVDLAGGGVAVSAVVDGPRGRSVAPCASETSSQWYFASGATNGGSTLRLSLFDPAPVLAVVDLSFITSSGSTSPMPYQGIVVRPMSVVTETVGRYVEDQGSVATVVSARSGAVVADELQLFGPGGASGVALSLGVPAPSEGWSIPRLVDAAGGTSAITVVNPTSVAERVRVDVRVAAGTVAPFTDVVGPEASWELRTSDELRIPTGEPYAATVRSSGGKGVVVARVGAGAPGSRTGQWSQAVTVPQVGQGAPSRWVVPAIGSGPDASKVLEVIGIENPESRAVRVLVGAVSAARSELLTVTIEARSFASVTTAGAAVVSADAPLALVGDASGAGAAGAVEVPAVSRSS